MLLYNVTFDENDTRTVLEPSVPESTADGEDSTTPRVCLSTSVKKCIQALAVEHREVRVGATLAVRTVNIDKLDEDLLITPETLVSEGLVPDALENDEHWYLGSIKFDYNKYEIEDFDAEIDLAWTCISLQDCRDIVTEYLPSFSTKRFKTSKNLYQAAMRFCNEFRLDNESDAIWDALAELPWAQKRTIKSVKLKKLHN